MKAITNEGNDPKIKSNPLQRDGEPLIIAGPCSAESPEQLLEVAQHLAGNKRVHYLRAGVWKPRTSPGSFQGMGVEALEWLRAVKAETGLPFAVEVGSERHVMESLKYGVDLMWVGARTVSNPFVVQEIAEAVRGVDIPVLLKNPLSPDMDLWEGAINRFLRLGIKHVGAIHRGFSWWGKSIFRNQPYWNLAEDLRKRMPGLPIICDPSHIAGKRSLVHLVAQHALEHRLDGLMIEVHPNPDVAKSDAAQQLKPIDFDALIDDLLGVRESKKDQSDDLLSELRSEVDIIDDLLVWALSNRMELVGQIANIKKAKSMEVVQQGRWEQVLNRVTGNATNIGLRPEFIQKLFDEIHSESCGIQDKIKKKDTGKGTKSA